jgi:manganese transport protein
VVEIEQAEALIAPLLGSTLAPILFGVALLCAGLNSTVTATLAGQIVMEGFINFRIRPWVRRMITRGLAIIPAIIVTMLYGNKGTANLLILSQVVLSLQLPFAIVPLIMFTSDRKKMGALRSPLWLTASAWLVALIVILLNLKLIYDVATGSA